MYPYNKHLNLNVFDLKSKQADISFSFTDSFASLFQAKNLHDRTGAKVVVIVKGIDSNPKRPPHKYDSDIDCRPQCKNHGERKENVVEEQAPENPPEHDMNEHTPRKRIKNLPGKSANTKARKVVKSKIEKKFKCSAKESLCEGLIYDSVQDKAFVQRYGKAATWIGCDFEGCNFWVHAMCVGRKISSKKQAEKIPFKCAEHEVDD